MQRAAPWLVRVGAVLLLISPFLPQARSDTGSFGACTMISALAGKLGGVERLAALSGLFAPALAGALLLPGAGRPRGGGAALRVSTLGFLLVSSFGLATLGSLLFTDAATRTVTPSFTLAIALFAGPLVLSGTALSRWMQGGLDRSTGAFERSALALLMTLHGLFLADCGWGYILLSDGIQSGTVRPLAGVWVGPLGGLLAVVGGFWTPPPSRAAVDTVAATG
ncbi:MAG TPA: hypothetical protein VKU80_16610 [Planctomycetota bacterium]|nr:hypothetical protein [Planctomycetota bacterium]